MIPAYWYSPVAFYLWQATLHSFVAAGVLYTWARHLRLPPGRIKRRVLVVVLVLPLATAGVPGRASIVFREEWAWLDSSRLLAVPLPGIEALALHHVALGVAALTAVISLVQEILPVLRRLGVDYSAAPRELVETARSLPGWDHCRVGITPEEGVAVATSGVPGRPRLLVSRGALARLGPVEMEAVVRHEHAHWRRGRWGATHLLFALRLLQLPNPVALWTFREYMVETEIACDADAVAGDDPRPLARALLAVYEGSHPGDLASRTTLQRRVDLLLGRLEPPAEPIATPAVLAGAALLMSVLPWVV